MLLVYLVGPTAAGKSAVAHELARHLQAPVLSADSMQVYRGMDIGTAKDKTARLVDLCDVTEPFDVKRYLTHARAELANLPAAIVCGGSGLYIRALRQGLFEGPGRDPALRQRLEARPAAELFAELQQCDPRAAADIDRHNPRRLVRALEVFHLTGRSIREWQTQRATSDRVFGLHRQRDDLYRRIEQRIDQQLAAGWLDEVRQLMQAGIERNPIALQAAGYRELIAVVRGELTLCEAVPRIKARTRQLARRQITWFRREPALQWVAVPADESPPTTAQRILEKLPSR